MRLLPAFLLAACALAAEIEAPRAGFVPYPDGALRPLDGVAGVLIPGAPALTGVEAASFNGAFGFALSADSVVVFDGSGRELARRQRPEGTAFFDRDSVWFAESGERWSWRRSRIVVESGVLPAPPPLLIGEREVVVRATGARIPLSFRPADIAWAGSDLLLVCGEGERALVRITPAREAAYVVPEVRR